MKGKKFEESCNTVEKWYKFKYNVTKISEEFIEKLSNAPKHQDHHLPLPNQFIATDFQIKPPPDDLERNKYPRLIKVCCFCHTHPIFPDFFKSKYNQFCSCVLFKTSFKIFLLFTASPKINIY